MLANIFGTTPWGGEVLHGVTSGVSRETSETWYVTPHLHREDNLPDCGSPKARWPGSKHMATSANLHTKILDFRGFDSSIISSLRGGILMSVGDFLEVLSQGILAGVILVGRLGAVGTGAPPPPASEQLLRGRRSAGKSALILFIVVCVAMFMLCIAWVLLIHCWLSLLLLAVCLCYYVYIVVLCCFWKSADFWVCGSVGWHVGRWKWTWRNTEVCVCVAGRMPSRPEVRWVGIAAKRGEAEGRTARCLERLYHT